MVFFSVIIPTYNRKHLIAQTLDSILAQRYIHFEILLIDDGSTDGTGELVKRKYGHEERLRYFYKKNEERGAARNYGMLQAKGNYLVFLDSDDQMRSDHLGTLAAYIDRDPDTCFFATKYNFFNGYTYVTADIQKLKEGRYDYTLLLKGNMFSCNFCVKNHQVALKRFEEDRMTAAFEDWLFLTENLIQHKIQLIDQTTVTMHDHNERSMRGDNQKLIEKRIIATHWISSRVKLSAKEKATLWAYSYYFCAVHAYLDRKRSQSLYLICKASINKFQKYFFLFAVKALLGRKLISMLSK